MKKKICLPTSLLSLCLLVSGLATAGAQPTNVYVDPSQNWIGYMNWQPTDYTLANFPGDGGYGGGVWGTSDLRASISASGIVTLLPNTNVYAPGNTYWVNPDGTGANQMDANFYVQNDNLAGDTVTFSGYLWTNSLAEEYATNVTAFIKDFNSGYALVGYSVTNLTNGGLFSVTLATSAGDHIQYGFEMLGPDANPTNAASLGEVIAASNAPPAGPAITSLPGTVYVNVTSNVSITVVATGNSLNYQWQKNGANLSDGAGISGSKTATLTLNDVSGSAEANYTVVVSDNLNRTTTGNLFMVVFDPDNLSFDPNCMLNGYVNTFYVNADGSAGAFATGFDYPPAQLRASISNGVAVLQPNISLYNINDPFWTNPDGTPNQYVEEDYFIANDTLAGFTLTLNGYCLGNNLDPSYTASVWIEDFAPDYSSYTSANSNLVAGMPFSITLPTEAGDHIQYGLRLFGLDNSPTNILTDGEVLVSIAPPVLMATRAGNLTTLSFPTVSGHSYSVQYKASLADGAWQMLATLNGSGANQTVNDATTQTKRFYRLVIQ